MLGALGLIFAKKAVHAALGMALVMINLGIFYIAEEAPFLGIVQIFVYTGAVMMLFLFVLMLVGVDSSDSLVETIKGQKWAACCSPSASPALLFSPIGRVTFAPLEGLGQRQRDSGNVTGVAELIFGKYVWTFEITSALLITAALGAMVLAHRERLGPSRASASWSERRVPRGRDLGRPAGARCLRPAQRGRHPGAAARRQPQRAVGLAGAHRRASRSSRPSATRVARAPSRPRSRREAAMNLVNYIYLATLLFAIGGAAVLVRRNAIIVFMGVELMLNSTNLAFVTFARMRGNLDGQVIALFVMVVAAAEVVVGLAIIMAIFRARRSASVDDANLLKL